MAKRAVSIRVRYLPVLLTGALSATAAGQTIAASPQVHVFSAIARGPNPPSQSSTVSSSGAGSLTWQITGRQAAWLTVGPRQGGTPSSLTFSVSIAGMRAGMYVDTVRVASAAQTDTIPVILRITDPASPGAPAGRVAVYAVEFSMTGYVGELNGAPQCKVRLNGFDRMVGTLIGVETSEQDDDMVYYGTLRRETDIDYCLTKGRKRPGDDERVWCELSLKGWSVENVEMTVHSDSARGGFLKSKTEPGYSSAGISRNTCDPQETRDAANGYANSDDGGGGSPSGQQIDDVKGTDPSGRRIVFSPDRLPRLRVGTFPPEGGTGWTLRVLLKIQ